MMHDIGWAVQMMRDGHRVTRAQWNGKDMYLFFNDNKKTQERLHRVENQKRNTVSFIKHDFLFEPHVVIKTADQKFIPWLCSQTDLLATDWSVV